MHLPGICSCIVINHVIIFVRKTFSCGKSMILNKFVIDFFPVSRTVFEIKTLIQNFSARWSCKRFHCVAQSHFNRSRHHFYDYSYFHLKIIGVATDFSGHTVYMYILCAFEMSHVEMTHLQCSIKEGYLYLIK